MSLNDNKIICPSCKSNNCFTESDKEKNTWAKICMSCGLTTQSAYKKDSEITNKMDKESPRIINDLKFIDNEDYVWYPSTIQISGLGMIYPIGNIKEWNWAVAKVMPIPLFDRMNYPIPNRDNEYYETKLDVENAKEFAPNKFLNACKELGIVKENINVTD